MIGRIVGHGSLTWDLCCIIENEPRFEWAVDVKEFRSALGGPMGNTLTFLARFGLRCEYRGPIGADEEGFKIASALSGEGVITDRLVMQPGASSRMTITLVDQRTGSRGFIYRPDTTTASAVEIGDLRKDDVLVLDEVTPESIYAARCCRDNGARVVFLGGWTRSNPDELLALSSVVIVSKAFARDWRPGLTVAQAFAELHNIVSGVAIMTDGDNGGLYADADRQFQFSAFRVKAKATNGAGDAFAAGFLFSYLRSRKAADCVQTAAACAAINVQHLSASEAPRSFAEVNQFLLKSSDLQLDPLPV